MANNYFSNLGGALFGRKPTYSNVEGDDLFNPQRKPPTAADAIITPTEGEPPVDPAKPDISKFAALLGAPSPSFTQSPGSITPQFGRLGDGGGAASGLGPVVMPSGNPLDGLGAAVSDPQFQAMIKKIMAKKATEPQQAVEAYGGEFGDN